MVCMCGCEKLRGNVHAQCGLYCYRKSANSYNKDIYIYGIYKIYLSMKPTQNEKIVKKNSMLYSYKKKVTTGPFQYI